MSMGTMTKGERTRLRVREAALALFAERGFEQTTLRDIAARAECALGLVYRYYASKEAIVLALYDELAIDFAARVADLDETTLAARFVAAMTLKLELVGPHREAFGALFASALNPASRVAVLGDAASNVRARVLGAFETVVADADDAPAGKRAELALLLYATHLAILLFWMHDRTPHARATKQVITLARDLLAFAAPALAAPPFADALARVALTLRPVFSSSEGARHE
jgi:AcrR family transcriptional regulator